MESMRSLNRSLPRSPTREPLQPPEDLQQAFKTAALTVTNLYKTAHASQTLARSAGYQDALDELLTFLDKQNIGLDDGEGWRIRQWATERLDGDGNGQANAASDSDDDRVDQETRRGASSPVPEPRPTEEIPQNPAPPTPAPPIRTTSPPEHSTTARQESETALSKPEIFTFTAPVPPPQDIEMQPGDDTNGHVNISTQTPTPAVRLEVVPRGSRTPHRSASGRHIRPTAAARSLGTGAGSKRRFAVGDYFDVGGFGDGRDNLGGGRGKRPRQ